MKKYFIVFLTLITGGLTWNVKSITLADTALAKELTLNQIKITGDEYIVLHNTTNANLQLGNFWLQYFNDFDLTHSSVSNSSAQLPAVWLQPGQEILLTVGTAANCGPVWVTKLPFTLKDSAGTLQVVNLAQTAGIIGYKPEDQVSWSSKTTDSVDVKGVSASAASQIYYKNDSGWLATATPPGCTALSTNTSPSTNTPDKLAQSSTSPPSVLVDESDDSQKPVGIPAADAGLMAPQLSEVLPNPASPQTDANDEYVELYNPNDKPFDLSGFSLKSGTTSTYKYIFSTGQSTLQPHEFKAFYSSQTNLALSNAASQIWLLSPTGDTLAQTDEYSDAKDGYTWILSDGKWQWTGSATPNARNVINTASATTTMLSSNNSSLPPAISDSQSYPKLVISELMPNPKSPQTDTQDEFIELYNPNSKPLDLKGYVLVTGTKDNHKYTIKNGMIGPKAYKAFYSSITGLSMSNTEGHAMLLASDGSGIDKTSDYTKAPAGDSWIYAEAKWQWTLDPTPNKANVLAKPVVLGASTTVSTKSPASVSKTGSFSSLPSGAAKSSLHPQVFAAVGSLALLYALYEYRHDLANRLYQFRRYRANRRIDR